jgi:hypothetical protein
MPLSGYAQSSLGAFVVCVMSPRLPPARALGLVVATLLLLASCSAKVAPSSTTIEGSEQTVSVLMAPFSEMGPEWTEQIFPYGADEELLGTAPGGEGLILGPEYGVQAPDGTWWFLDAAKQRIAHFADDGTYLDQVSMPEDLLVDGVFFQYQLPHALDDGSIAATGYRGEDAMALLLIADGVASGLTFEGNTPWVLTDGVYLYGLDFEGGAHRLDPGDPVAEPVDWLVARDGSRFMVTVNADEVLVELPDAPDPLTRTLQMRFSEDPEITASGAIEVATGADGTLFIFFYGAPTSDETLGIGGFVSVSPDGVVSEAQAITNPFTPSDPGSPAHLGVRPGTSTPWVMVVDEDGVRVFTMTG